MRPITRIEMYLAALANDEDAVSLPAPITRVEMYLAKIAGETVTLPETPITRIEMYLAKIAGEDVAIPERPITFVEMYLAAIAGEDNDVPEPITRVEMYLAKWVEESAEVIATVTGVSPLILANALAKPIRSLVQYGKCVSSDGSIYCNNGALRYGALGINLLDPSPSNVRLQYYINKADGEEKPSPPNFMFEGYMPVEGGKTYVAYGRAKSGNDLSDYNRVAWYDSTKTWISGADYTQNRIAVVTAPSNAAYARFSCNPSGTTAQTVTQEIVDSYNWMFAEGTAEITPFVPFVGGIYTDGTPETLTISATGETSQTVTGIPDLFATLDGTVRDEVDLVSGVVTRRTEAVYENGAVVIRALATPVTEQTTPHELHSYAGDTTVSWTAAVSGTTKTVEYAQGTAPSGDSTVGTAKVGTAKVA